MPTMTDQQRELARHALGLPNKVHRSYHNRFVTGKGSTDYPHWLSMYEMGFASRSRGGPLTGGDDLFCLTRAGAKMALNPGEKLDQEDFPDADE